MRRSKRIPGRRESKRRHNYERNIFRSTPDAQSDGKTFLIVVEGKETERRYLLGLRARLELKSANVVVVHAGATDPQNMISAAVELREQREELAKNSLLTAPYDEVWVVFDTEAQNHVRAKQLPSAIALAKSRNVLIALSNPCFEFWLLLHYIFTTKPFQNPKAVITALRKCDPGYKKSDLPMQELVAAVRKAIANAISCVKYHASSGGDGNPSTHMHCLVDSLNRSAAPVFRI